MELIKNSVIIELTDKEYTSLLTTVHILNKLSYEDFEYVGENGGIYSTSEIIDAESILGNLAYSPQVRVKKG